MYLNSYRLPFVLGLPATVNILNTELCRVAVDLRHIFETYISRLFMISHRSVNFLSKPQSRFCSMSCFPLVMQIPLGNDAQFLTHSNTLALPESTEKLGLLEVCIWDCVLSSVVKWSAHANRPIMYILSWHCAILKLELCISALAF